MTKTQGTNKFQYPIFNNQTNEFGYGSTSLTILRMHSAALSFRPECIEGRTILSLVEGFEFGY
jgi:hypothetical protein